MLSSAQYITPKPAALPPAAQPVGAGSAGGPSFAQFLNEQPAPVTPPAHTDPVPSEPDKAAEPTPERAAAPAPATNAANTAAARRNQANAASAKPTTPAASKAPDAADPAKAGEDTMGCESGGTTTDAAADIGQAPETAGLNEFTQLIGLTVPAQPVAPAQAVAMSLPVAATAPVVDAEAGADSAEPAIKGGHAARAARLADDELERVPSDKATKATEGAEVSTPAASQRRPAEAPVRAADTPQARSVELATDKAAGRSTDALQAASTPATSPQAATASDAITPSFAAVLGQALPSAAATSDAAQVTATSQLQAPLHSSAFAPELAASVSLLAVDGVQQAELQLNPADMGPVSVQIVVDGAQAHVSFHAAQADTRQALEQSLPDLAAALQGQGLTLSGGGVFQQTPRDSKGDAADASSGEGRSSRAGAGGGRIGGASAAAVPVRRTVGLLDTFA